MHPGSVWEPLRQTAPQVQRWSSKDIGLQPPTPAHLARTRDSAVEASPAPPPPPHRPRPGRGRICPEAADPRADQICAVRLGGFLRRNPQALWAGIYIPKLLDPPNKGPVGEGWPASLELPSPRALPPGPDLLGEKSGHSGESYPLLPQCTNSHYSRVNTR